MLYASSLAKKMNYDWDIKVPPNEVDWPDLLINPSKDAFGLEVRDFYVDEDRKGSIVKKGESYRQKLLSDLSVKYYKKKSVPILLDIRGPFDKDSVVEILDYLLSTEFQEGSIMEHDISIKGNKTTLFVERLNSSFANYSYWKYMNDTIGWVERIKDEDIEKIVKEKSVNIHRYKKNVNNISLLIVANRINNSGKLLLEKRCNINTYGFNKVFFYMHPLEAIVYESD